MITIEPADIYSPSFAALLEAHASFCNALSPEESCHHLPLDELSGRSIYVWQVVLDKKVVGMGALKELSATSGEVKSMHTLAECRGMGAARKIMQTILNEANIRQYESLWLETGSHESFTPARDLYASLGFKETGPFGDYVLDPHSTFMTLSLTKHEQA